MAALTDMELDKILENMLAAKANGPKAKVKLPEEKEVKKICSMSRDIFLEQDTFLQLEAPITLIGDIHGQYHDLIRIFEYGGFPPETNYLFLGDYVDRGKHSLKVIILP